MRNSVLLGHVQEDLACGTSGANGTTLAPHRWKPRCTKPSSTILSRAWKEHHLLPDSKAKWLWKGSIWSMTKVRVISSICKPSQTFVKPTSEDFQLSHLSARPKQESCPVFGSSTAWSHPISTPTKICSGGTCDVAHLSTLDILDTHREHAEKCRFFFGAHFKIACDFSAWTCTMYTHLLMQKQNKTLWYFGSHLHINCPIRVSASAEVISSSRLLVGPGTQNEETPSARKRRNEGCHCTVPKIRPQVAECSMGSALKKSKQLLKKAVPRTSSIQSCPIPTYLPIYLSTCLPIYLSTYLAI